MKYTSAEAAKLLRRLNEEREALLALEMRSRCFVAAVSEDPDSVRPAYDFAAVQEKLAALEEKIRRVKHALNVFNSTCPVPSFGMTIDQMLVYIPQLSQRKMKLQEMAAVLPKVRDTSSYAKNSALIDYRYANYDVEAVRAAAEAAADELARAQTALDRVNNTETMEIDL